MNAPDCRAEARLLKMMIMSTHCFGHNIVNTVENEKSRFFLVQFFVCRVHTLDVTRFAATDQKCVDSKAVYDHLSTVINLRVKFGAKNS